MKAITLWQPWASAIALGLKKYETRGWPAVAGGERYRGWLAICAAKTKKNPDNDELLQEALSRIVQDSNTSGAAFFDAGYSDSLFDPVFDRLPLGKIVAVCWLENSTPISGLQVDPLEKLWGIYEPGRWAWQFTQCWRVNEPIPVRGDRKLFEVAMPANWQDQCTKVY